MPADVPENRDEPLGDMIADGTLISHYKVIRKIGSGGMGEVYLAEDTVLNRRVALKFLSAALASDKAFKTRFMREAQAAAGLSHPNIIHIYEVSEYRERPFFVMEYVEGRSLWQILREKSLSIDEIIELSIQICEGLSKAHQMKVTHRDIKPSNIIVDSEDRPKILDFGLATIQGSEHLTRSGTPVGTADYMAPEQALAGEVDHRCDLFSFGIVLYEMIAGRTPFHRGNVVATAQAIVNDLPEPLAGCRPDIPEELLQTASKLLEKDPALRYQNAAGVVSDLKRLKRDRESGEISGVSAAGLRRSRPFPYVLLTGVVLLVAASVTAYFLLIRPLLPALRKTGDTGWEASIAVMPFRDFSPERDQEFLCNGMTDAIIGKLTGLKQLKTISMSSVMQYKDDYRDTRKIAEELSVSAVLEGSIQREGNRIRVRAQLIDVGTDSQLWSETYDRELESIFTIQDDISRSIADALRIRLIGEEETLLVKRYTDNIDAYNAYVQGRFLWNKRTEDNLRIAIGYFERAIALDSGYALAYSGLADAWSVLPDHRAVADSEVIPQAREAALKAISLDEELAEAHASLGLVYIRTYEHERSEQEFLRAIELNPGYAYAHYWYSLLLNDLGRSQESLRELEVAYDLDPLSVVIVVNLASKKRSARNFTEAEELMKRAIEIEPNRALTYVIHARGLRQVGRLDEAAEQFMKALEVDPDYNQAYIGLAYTYNLRGDFEQALWAANKAIELAPDAANPYDTRGEIYAMNGRLTEAIADFQKAIALDPFFITSHLNLVNTYLFNRDYKSAETHIRGFLADPDIQIRSQARAALALIPLYQGKFAEAHLILDEEFAEDGAPEALESQIMKKFLKAEIYLELEKPALAVIELDVAHDAIDDADTTETYCDKIAYVHLLAENGKFERAKEAAEDMRQCYEEQTPGLEGEYWR
ncbi:MAG: protein kinase, partial [Candidatus Zixiibacteriota bacterium]